MGSHERLAKSASIDVCCSCSENVIEAWIIKHHLKPTRMASKAFGYCPMFIPGKDMALGGT